MTLFGTDDPQGLIMTIYISQGFVTYKAPIGKGLDFKFGKFCYLDWRGTLESVDNPNFSRSLAYQNVIPFTNTGLAVSYPFIG